MNAITNFLYQRIVQIARGLTIAQGLKIRTSGLENIPSHGGAVIVTNHTGYLDMIFAGFLPHQKKRLVRFLAKSSIFTVPVAGQLMQLMGHVPVDRIDGGASLRKARALAESGELVGIFSEGTISRSFEIRSMRSGAVRIAHEAGVPVIPQVTFGSQRIWTKGQKKNLGRSKTPVFIKALEPYWPTGEADADTAEIRRRMQEGLEGLWADYEAEFGQMPQGAYWVPARRGGGAPTLEEAESRDHEVETERYRVRRLRDDLVGLKDRVTEATTVLVRERLAITAKPAGSGAVEPRRTAPETIDWIKDNLNAVVEEATRGLEEGREKVTDLVAQLRVDVAEAQASMTANGREILAGSLVEQGLLGAATQSRLIVSRLPHRMKANFSSVPRVIVADESALTLEDGVLTTRLRESLTALSPDSQVLVLVSPKGATLSDASVAGLPHDLWRVEHHGALVTHGGEIVAVNPVPADLVEAIKGQVTDVPIDWAAVATDEGEVVLSGLAAGTMDGVREALGELAEQVQLWDDRNGIAIVAASRDVAVERVLQDAGAELGDVLVFANEPGDEVFLHKAQVVALETAPIDLVKGAQSVTYSAERSGMAEVLEAIARLQKAKKK